MRKNPCFSTSGLRKRGLVFLLGGFLSFTHSYAQESGTLPEIQVTQTKAIPSPSILNLSTEDLENPVAQDHTLDSLEIDSEEQLDKPHYKIYTPPELGKFLLLILGISLLLLSYGKAWSNFRSAS